ncbi:hypothetical protein D3C79_1013790 [compost metagenome]
MQLVHEFMCTCPQRICINRDAGQSLRQDSQFGFVTERGDRPGNRPAHPDRHTTYEQGDAVQLKLLILLRFTGRKYLLQTQLRPVVGDIAGHSVTGDACRAQ